MFSTKTSEVKALCNITEISRSESPEAEIFRKRTAKFWVDAPFPVRFLKISASGDSLCEITVSYAVSPSLIFSVETLHCSYVNCKGFHKHEKLFMIMVQQLLKRWNIRFDLSEIINFANFVAFCPFSRK